jgi:anti-sigma factor RsiW
MQCEHITELLLADDEGGRTPEVDQHLASCTRCAHVAQGVGHLNAVLQSVLVAEPPLELQRQLAALVETEAVTVAAPRRAAWWSRLFSGDFKLPELVLRPNTIAAQGLAAIMLALASWQMFGWLSTFQPVVGDIGYAVQLVATSPASAYLGGLQIDFQSLGVWSVVGLAAWLVSDTGPIGRRLPGLRLP